ncbi:MAG: ThuA domain-containing protein [Planctomycetaceae bacterium]|nr:ThuA domain-containing protein [Planctomycetaceae bacterium]
MMQRRDFLAAAGLAALTAAFPLHRSFGQEGSSLGATRNGTKKAKILYFSRSQGFEHDPVKLVNGGPSVSDTAFAKWGAKNNMDFVCTKDGTVFDGDLDQFDGFAFYTSGDLLAANATDGSKPMSEDGMKRFLKAVEDGKGFVGYHAATDSMKSQGEAFENQTQVHPYIRMIGGEFIRHDAQQTAPMVITQPVDLPWLKDKGEAFDLWDEWYALKNFNKDIHVILIQETKDMDGPSYNRPAFPATWAQQYGKGRSAYTSIGHLNSIWEDDNYAQFFGELIEWSVGRFDMDVTPNMDKVTPEASILQRN